MDCGSDVNIRTLNGTEVVSEIKMNTDGITIKNKDKNTIVMKDAGMVVTAEKISIGDSGETIKKILLDLITAIKAMTLMTNMGATIAPPINIADFEGIKTRINTFMEIS